MKAILSSPINEPCDKCGARPGEKCMSNGTLVSWKHNVRIDRAHVAAMAKSKIILVNKSRTKKGLRSVQGGAPRKLRTESTS